MALGTGGGVDASAEATEVVGEATEGSFLTLGGYMANPRSLCMHSMSLVTNTSISFGMLIADEVMALLNTSVGL